MNPAKRLLTRSGDDGTGRPPVGHSKVDRQRLAGSAEKSRNGHALGIQVPLGMGRAATSVVAMTAIGDGNQGGKGTNGKQRHRMPSSDADLPVGPTVLDATQTKTIGGVTVAWTEAAEETWGTELADVETYRYGRERHPGAETVQTQLTSRVASAVQRAKEARNNGDPIIVVETGPGPAGPTADIAEALRNEEDVVYLAIEPSKAAIELLARDLEGVGLGGKVHFIPTLAENFSIEGGKAQVSFSVYAEHHIGYPWVQNGYAAEQERMDPDNGRLFVVDEFIGGGDPESAADVLAGLKDMYIAHFEDIFDDRVSGDDGELGKMQSLSVEEDEQASAEEQATTIKRIGRALQAIKYEGWPSITEWPAVCRQLEERGFNITEIFPPGTEFKRRLVDEVDALIEAGFDIVDITLLRAAGTQGGGQFLIEAAPAKQQEGAFRRTGYFRRLAARKMKEAAAAGAAA